MKRLVLAGLIYVVATLQTSSMGTEAIDLLLLLAACVVSLLSAKSALPWAFAIGFVDGLIGTGAPGAVSLVYVISAYLTMVIVSDRGSRVGYTTLVMLPGFVVSANLFKTLLVTPVDSVNWSDFAITTSITWFISCLAVLSIRLTYIMADRFRQSSGAGGAMGTPVGLELR